MITTKQFAKIAIAVTFVLFSLYHLGYAFGKAYFHINH
jgi:hypothetical protein